jgi:protein gp37
MTLTKTKIEYLDYCWNFYTGCLHWKTGVCPVGKDCWALKGNGRFHRDFTPTLHPKKLLDALTRRHATKRIGVCFTGDLFGDWVNPNQEVDLTPYKWGIAPLNEAVKYIITQRPQHQFFFLTKNPAGYQNWGVWPENAWLGATVCNDKMLDVAVDKLEDTQAKHKWISFEPLMGRLTLSLDYALYFSGISWVIIGGWSGGKNPPNIKWVLEIINACNKTKIPLFIKRNLSGLGIPLRQEYPRIKVV